MTDSRATAHVARSARLPRVKRSGVRPHNSQLWGLTPLFSAGRSGARDLVVVGHQVAGGQEAVVLGIEDGDVDVVAREAPDDVEVVPERDGQELRRCRRAGGAAGTRPGCRAWRGSRAGRWSPGRRRTRRRRSWRSRRARCGRSRLRLRQRELQRRPRLGRWRAVGGDDALDVELQQRLEPAAHHRAGDVLRQPAGRADAQPASRCRAARRRRRASAAVRSRSHARRRDPSRTRARPPAAASTPRAARRRDPPASGAPDAAPRGPASRG